MLIDALAVLIECGELNGKSDDWGNYGRTNRWAGGLAGCTVNQQLARQLPRQTHRESDRYIYIHAGRSIHGQVGRHMDGSTDGQR